jgi:hypothetical protein
VPKLLHLLRDEALSETTVAAVIEVLRLLLASFRQDSLSVRCFFFPYHVQ